MKTIESTSNKEIKALCKLHAKKGRLTRGQFLVEGMHLIEEAKEAGHLLKVFSIEPLDLGVECVLCLQPVLNKLSVQRSDASCIGLCSMVQGRSDLGDHVLLLMDVQDPGNMGTLIRSALSFGFRTIYYSNGCADPYSPKVVQASQGALFHTLLQEVKMESAIPALRKDGFWVAATALSAYSKFLHDVHFPKKTAFLLGNEGSGLPLSLIDLCDACIKVEMDCFESLNVGVAGSLCMYSCFIQNS
ncbi:TrmH family RNA methyltransferase [Dubosiella newyorkensis]|uniref:TrmH family RNA methyltransferase n=2 Tax=Dubosiella newyorkensis TaxID=1862672 RepID=UPI002731DAD0|nr:RNA methyltransferase [Dubosiella newyorkensis]